MKFNLEKLGKAGKVIRNTAMIGVATFGISKEAASQNLDNSTTHKKDSIETIKKINPESHQVVNDKVRNDWNQFSAWMDEQGMKGNSELDKNGLGYKYFDKYVKNHQTRSEERSVGKE